MPSPSNRRKPDVERVVQRKPIPRVQSMPKMAAPLKSVLKAPTSQAMFLMRQNSNVGTASQKKGVSFGASKVRKFVKEDQQ